MGGSEVMMLQVQELVNSFQQLSLLEQQSVLEMLQQTYQERVQLESLTELTQRYPGEWLAVVIPGDEDPYSPKRGYLLAHGREREVVWQSVATLANDKDIFIFYTGPNAAKGFVITFHDGTDTPEVAELVK